MKGNISGARIITLSRNNNRGRARIEIILIFYRIVFFKLKLSA